MMERSSNSSATNSNTSSQLDNTLRQLNKASHKISKPVSRPQNSPNPNPNLGAIRPAQQGSGAQNISQPTQPPVYNINKNDFRDVVQRLTGSPAHHGPLPPSAVSTPQRPPAVSRLHRIRPPPLVHLAPATRPPPLLAAQLSPLPPFPAVSAAAESPITAYMRRLRAVAPGQAAPPQAPLPPAPLAFGCAPPMSPGSAAYLATLSPTLLFPTSPGPLPSPRWNSP